MPSTAALLGAVFIAFWKTPRVRVPPVNARFNILDRIDHVDNKGTDQGQNSPFGHQDAGRRKMVSVLVERLTPWLYEK